MKPFLISIVVVASACSESVFEIAWRNGDTLATTFDARAGVCPSGDGLIVEGFGDELAALIYLPADTVGEYRIGDEMARAAFHRVVSRQRVDEREADSGLVYLDQRAGATMGSFTLWFRDGTLEGSFRARATQPDSTACYPPSTLDEGA